MNSIKFSLILFSVLFVGLSLAQNKNKPKQPLDAMFMRSAQVALPEPEPKITVPLKVLMDGKQECPRLQELGAKLLNDPKYCDIELEVFDPRLNESRVFCAHKSILCLRSSVLNDKIAALLKTHTGPNKPRLKIEGLNPDIFEYILQFIYTDKIDPNFNLKQNIMDLYVAADYAKIPELNAMIKEYLYDSVDPNDVSNYLKWAQKYGHKEMKYFLLDITRTALKMNANEWRQFVKSMCESYSDDQDKGFLDTIVNPIIKPAVEEVAHSADPLLKAPGALLKNLNLGGK